MTGRNDGDEAKTRSISERAPAIDPAPDLLRSIRRMYPTLARAAAAVSRLHRGPPGRGRSVPVTREVP
jgi:hypothetical protein